jgi:hypothetical protein
MIGSYERGSVAQDRKCGASRLGALVLTDPGRSE